MAGLTVLGSEPVRVASPGEDPFAVLDSAPDVRARRRRSRSAGDGSAGSDTDSALGSRSCRRARPRRRPSRCSRSPSTTTSCCSTASGGGSRRSGVRSARPRCGSGSRCGRSACARPRRLARDVSLTPFAAGEQRRRRSHCRRGRLPRAGSPPASSSRPTCASGSRPRFSGDLVDLLARALPEARPRFGALVDGVVSLSPERFLRRKGRQVETEPIKGTRPRAGADAEREAAREELVGSGKDAAEHVMIVDLMRNDLGRVCEYGTIARRAGARRGALGRVAPGLHRRRAGCATGVGDAELLRATFPPGSVTGAPKVQAMKVIATLEATRRELYTGAVGDRQPASPGWTPASSSARSRPRATAIWFGAGGGIVADSDPELELAEALAKAAGPVAAIGGVVADPRPPVGRRPVPSADFALAHGDRPDPAAGSIRDDVGRGRRGRFIWPNTSSVWRGRCRRSTGRGLTRLRSGRRWTRGDRPPPARARGSRSPARPRRPRRPGHGQRRGGRSAARRAACSDAVRAPGRPRRPQVARPRLLDALSRRGARHHAAARRHRRARARGRVRQRLDRRGRVAGHPPADGRILPGITRAVLLRPESARAREEQLDLDRLASRRRDLPDLVDRRAVIRRGWSD